MSFKLVLFFISSVLILHVCNAYNKAVITKSIRINSLCNTKWTKLYMSDTVEKTAVKKDKNAAQSKVDYSKFAVGQTFDATVLSAKDFGVFATLPSGANVLIPRSQMSKGSFEKFKIMAANKSKDTIRLELINVSVENQSMSAKHSPENVRKVDLLELSKETDVTSKDFTATVVGVHDFGLFAEIDELGLEGLVPVSKITRSSDSSLQSSYKVGSTVVVKIDNIDVDNKKVVFNMRTDTNRGGETSTTVMNVNSNRWTQGVVQSVTSFGLFVRPARSDTIGLVHYSRIPKDLLFSLKKQSPVPTGSDKSDIEHLFSAGDVVKIRIQSTDEVTKRIELSMLPFRANVEEEDDYTVDGRDTEEQEEEDEKTEDPEEGSENYNAEDTLVWWRGAPYGKVGETTATESLDEELVVLQESTSVVEGSWRRMFEMDMREDEADFSSKAFEADMKEMEEEIGELNGLDEDLMGANYGISGSFNTKSFGSFVSFANLPSDWKGDLDFFKGLDSIETANSDDLHGGKAKEQLELESLLREVELEMQQANKRPPAPAAEERKEASPAVVESEGSEGN